MCLGPVGVLKRGCILAALAALLLPSAAGAWSRTTVLVPGVTYTKEVRWVHDGPLVTHVITAPRPGGLYGLRPVLSNETVLRTETVTSMQRRYSSQATLAGVNGDFFSLRTGRSSGIFMRDGVLAARPYGAGRSALGIAFDGTLRVAGLRYFGSWTAAGFPSHPLEQLNRPIEDRRGVMLFTSKWGGRTPTSGRPLDVVLADLPPVVPNGYLTARVVARRAGGGTLVPPGGAVLQARGFWRSVFRSELVRGRAVTIRVKVKGLWTDVADAIGGGPVLVRGGQAIFRAGEEFTSYQLAQRHPRTAVGQLADGRIILVVADGRSSASAGLRNWELALEMVRLGAVTAMALDAGGSSTSAFDGRVLNVPSDGRERSVADGLFVFYYGAFAPRPSHPVVSPNGDGVLDAQTLRAKIVRRSQVDVRLVRPDGAIAWRYRGALGRQTLVHDLGTVGRSGTWRWVVNAMDGRGRRSGMVRRFLVNNTLGHLRLSASRMRVVPGQGGRIAIRADLTRRSAVAVNVRRAYDGHLVRRIFAGERPAGPLFFRWDGRNKSGYVVRGGVYRIRVQATNDLGTIRLERRLEVVRAS